MSANHCQVYWEKRAPTQLIHPTYTYQETGVDPVLDQAVCRGQNKMVAHFSFKEFKIQMRKWKKKNTHRAKTDANDAGIQNKENIISNNG